MVCRLLSVTDRRVTAGENVEIEKWEADYRHVLTSNREANDKRRIVLLDAFVLQSGCWMTKGREWDASRAQTMQALSGWIG